MIHPIYVMAAVTSVVALAAWGTLLWQICPRDNRRPLVINLVLLGFFMSPAAYFLVRRPVLIGPLEPAAAASGCLAGLACSSPPRGSRLSGVAVFPLGPKG